MSIKIGRITKPRRNRLNANLARPVNVFVSEWLAFGYYMVRVIQISKYAILGPLKRIRIGGNGHFSKYNAAKLLTKAKSDLSSDCLLETLPHLLYFDVKITYINGNVYFINQVINQQF